ESRSSRGDQSPSTYGHQRRTAQCETYSVRRSQISSSESIAGEGISGLIITDTEHHMRIVVPVQIVEVTVHIPSQSRFWIFLGIVYLWANGQGPGRNFQRAATRWRPRIHGRKGVVIVTGATRRTQEPALSQTFVYRAPLTYIALAPNDSSKEFVPWA